MIGTLPDEPNGLIDINDVYFDLNYGGLGIDLETVGKLTYDGLYRLWKRLKTQKEYERKKLNERR